MIERVLVDLFLRVVQVLAMLIWWLVIVPVWNIYRLIATVGRFLRRMISEARYRLSDWFHSLWTEEI